MLYQRFQYFTKCPQYFQTCKWSHHLTFVIFTQLNPVETNFKILPKIISQWMTWTFLDAITARIQCTVIAMNVFTWSADISSQIIKARLFQFPGKNFHAVLTSFNCRVMINWKEFKNSESWHPEVKQIFSLLQVMRMYLSTAYSNWPISFTGTLLKFTGWAWTCSWWVVILTSKALVEHRSWEKALSMQRVVNSEIAL